jgi:N-methylhydantoinase A
VAVVLLHSYAYPAHEAAVAAGLRASGLPCSVSSELLPEYREYERMTTTVVNAAVAPIVSGYLGRLERCGLAQRVRIMGSSGGVLPVERARSAAAATILSGPAGGVAGALHAAARHGIADIVTFDMGGTSTDVSLCPGRALHTREFMVAGVPVALPVLDIHTVGAGGGSIARLDSGGALRVGPESAGAVPGPVCYGRGGTELTVTDANVALGRLIAVDDGALAIDASLIDAPLAQLARALDCTPAEAAAGIIAVIDTAMEGALRVISVERGHDPAGFTLVPFGGAAGLHAAALAERLEIPRILVPPAPGVLSAYGMLVAPPRRDVVRTVLLRDPADDVLAAIFAELELAARAALHEDGVDDVALHRTVAARYRGQSHELAVGAAAWREAFHTAHEQRFGYALRDAAVEAVTLRVEAVGPAPAVPVPHLARAHGAPPALGTRQMHAAGRVITAAVYRRETLLAGHVVRGPALVPERTASLWVPAAWQGEVLADGAVLLERAVT